NASEALNLVARTFPLGSGDRVVITEMEHHSNIVPWQLATERSGAELRWFGLTDDGRLDLSNIDELLTPETKIVALTWVSNMLGTINPVAEIARRAHEVGAVVVLDASQAAPQLPIDVQAVDADFLAFTGHKVTGPTGIGVLWGRTELLDQLPPFLGGGEMIATVSMEGSTWAPIPHKFEAGTPPIVEAIGLGAAVRFMMELGRERIQAHEAALSSYAHERLRGMNALRIIGQARGKGAIIAFEMNGAHAHDVATVIDRQGVAVRAGTHCAMPLLTRFGATSTCRASFGLYNTMAEVDKLAEALTRAEALFA
ncbi:MAG: cysteine desulfurase, partial [Microvirga sp.]